MSKELRPCPFCGGEASVACGSIMGPARWVECEDCGAEGSTQFSNESAAEAWNRRAERWIPVSERLPEQADLYLVCNRMGALWIEEWISEPTSDWVGTANIIAWRPLPEPYEEEKDAER